VSGLVVLKLCLVNAAPNEGIDEREGRKSIAAFPPLGILYLATILEQAGVEVALLDQAAMGSTVSETAKWIEKEKPNIVGFSALASSGRMAALLSSRVKENDPNVTTIIGNHYATFNAERILRKYPSVDIVVREEAEETIIELFKAFQKNEDLKKIKGIGFRNKNAVIITPDRPLIKDLNLLPFPNRKLLRIEYHSLMAGANIAPKKFTGIISSRGCSFGCRFCSCTTLAHNVWRARSAENTLEELKQLASEGYKQLVFVDDAFTLNPKRVIELCRGIRREKLHFDWICEGRVDSCSFEMLREMVAAGLKVIYFGIENANQRILDYYHKRITPQQAETAVRTARKAGVDVIAGSFIVGTADETREEIQETINFAKRVPIDIPQFSILGAHPGNDIWNEFEAKGLLNAEEHWETGIAVAEIAPTAVPLEEIKRTINKAFFSHIIRPQFLLGQAARTIKSGYRMSVALSNLNRLLGISADLHQVA
jgi:anaerobic magnesium-protoporphyrin IX monomethyl ester cyclase